MTPPFRTIDEVAPEHLVDQLLAPAQRLFASGTGLASDHPRVRALADVLARHVQRPDFRAVGAFEVDETLVGFAYGYRGGSGQSWHDQVRAHLDEDAAQAWLDDCFRLCELHVHPARRGEGLGGALHDRLLQRVTTPTVAFTVPQDAAAARALCARRGWQVLANPVRLEGTDTEFALLGRQR